MIQPEAIAGLAFLAFVFAVAVSIFLFFVAGSLLILYMVVSIISSAWKQ